MAEAEILGGGLDIDGWNAIKVEQNRNANCLTDKSFVQRQLTPLVRQCHLPKEWRQEAFDIVVGALEQNTVIDAPWIAEKIKVGMDTTFGPSWQVIIGEDFTFSIDFERFCLVYLFYGNVAILVWKCGDITPLEVNHLSDPKTKDKLKAHFMKTEKAAEANSINRFRDLFAEKI